MQKNVKGPEIKQWESQDRVPSSLKPLVWLVSSRLVRPTEQSLTEPWNKDLGRKFWRGTIPMLKAEPEDSLETDSSFLFILPYKVSEN